MNKWIKPSKLPDDFWGEVFVMVKSQYTDYRTKNAEIHMVKKEDHKVKHYNTATNSWWRIDDKQYRVMLIQRPEQDWSAFE